MSQIGYMMLAAGLGVAGYAFAIFHLLMHGFFKANMFLGAGSVMHGMNDDVDMRHYGMVRKMMPVTFLTFAMGYLAIIGFPGFSGFWSKDKIIETALADNWLVGLCALLGAGITGFYMTRMMLMTFFTEKRWEKGVHPHESPKVMTIPLIVLAALSVFGGIVLLDDWIVDFLAPVTGTAEHEDPPIPALAVSADRGRAWSRSASRWPGSSSASGRSARGSQDVSFVTRAGREEVYGNGINDALVVNPGRHAGRGLCWSSTSKVVDGVLTGGPIGGRRTRRLAAPGPERLRPLLRPVPARRRPDRRRWPSWR